MELRDYFVGRKFVLHSPLRSEEVKQRIKEASGSIFWPFGVGVAGGFLFGRLNLHVQNGPFTYNAKPALTGKLHDTPGGTELSVSFGAPWFALIFFPFWYLMIAFTMLPVLSPAFSGESAVDPIMFFAFALFCLFPLVLHFAFTRNADEELEELLDFLEREAGAVCQPYFRR